MLHVTSLSKYHTHYLYVIWVGSITEPPVEEENVFDFFQAPTHPAKK